MAFLTMRQDFRAPAFGPASTQEIYAAALEQFAWADEHRLRHARALGAPRRRRRLDARRRSRWPRPCSARTERARVMVERVDLAAARPDPHRRADRRARQRVPGPAVGRVRRGLPRRGVRDGRRSSTRRAAACSKSTSRRGARGAGRRRRSNGGAARSRVTPKPVTRPAPHAVRRAAAYRPRRAGPRGCGSRCSR